MRIALISDIHANREAYEAVLDAAARQEAARYVMLGDIVGYGADPAWCTRKTMELAESGAIVVRGNHDQALDDPAISMNETATAAIDWTRGQLGADERAFLAGLPLQAEEGDRLYVHSNAATPARFSYVTDTDDALRQFVSCRARLIFCGHLHRPALYCLGGHDKVSAFIPTSANSIPLLSQRRWLAVMGSVGQPRDGNPAAALGILDTEKGELEFHRVGYDIETAAAKIRAAGLPDSLAARLFRGR